ncbi:MAG: hypothetical protein K8R59_17285 [Thermoanaerobaculales bacterium]|nr:hypothetical protein [Thermoanaerobaculales bacterium]
MRRNQLEHIIRAAATIADDDDIVVIGSQSILGQFPDAPRDLCVSVEADVWPRNHPERWELIDGAIGELSLFHDTFGYYAQGVGRETAVLPAGWEERLIAVTTPATRGATGWCLEVHDLVISKYVAGREKDRLFIRTVISNQMVDKTTLQQRLNGTQVSSQHRSDIASHIERDFSRPGILSG